MGKHRRWILAAVALVVVGFVVWLVSGPREPRYQGQPLSYWLQGYDIIPVYNQPPEAIRAGGPTAVQATEALAHIGTNAIPTLLDLLRAKDTPLKLTVMDGLRRIGLARFAPRSAWNKYTQAYFAFNALGARGQPAVPGIIQIYTENISDPSREHCLAALASIGPAASNAVPFLVAQATNQAVLKPGLLQTLGKIHSDPARSVPVLTNALQHPDFSVRYAAVQALLDFGPDASNAVPALHRAKYDRSPDVRTKVEEALKAIVPPAAPVRTNEVSQ